MSKLFIKEIDGSQSFQTITPTSNLIVEAFRPHIYRHNSPTGSLRIKVNDNNGKLIKQSSAVTISSIGTLAFFHGLVKFDINVGLQKDQSYRIELVGEGGYTFSESAYIGWVNDFDLRRVSASYSPNVDFNAALGMEIWTRGT